MKNKKFDASIPLLIYLLFTLTMLYPVGIAVSSLFGYTFKLTNVVTYTSVVAILSVCAVVLTFILKIELQKKSVSILLTCLPLISMINAMLLVFFHGGLLVIVNTFVSALCCFVMALFFGKHLVLKIFLLTLSVLMIFPFAYLSFISFIFGDLPHNTVVQTVESPNEKYYAQVINSDQGALGGNTLVDVYKGRKMNFIIFTLEKKPERVYEGDWGYGEHMDIYWKDDKCLIIDSKEHVME